MGSRSTSVNDSSEKTWESNNASTNQASGGMTQLGVNNSNNARLTTVVNTLDAGAIAGAFSMADATGRYQADGFSKLLDTFSGTLGNLRSAQTDAYDRAAGTVSEAMGAIKEVANTSRDGLSPGTMTIIGIALVAVIFFARK